MQAAFSLTTLWAALVLAVVAATPLLARRPAAAWDFVFEVRLQSSTPGMAQLFYDIGHGVREEDSAQVRIAQGDTPATYRFRLPRGVYRALRFDPIDGEGVVTFSGAKIFDVQHTLIKHLAAAQFRAIQQVRTLQIEADAVQMVTVPHANDPMLAVSLDTPLLLGMERQAHMIAQWGAHVYVKIPVTNTAGESSAALIRTLAQAGVQVNVTALMTLAQVQQVRAALAEGPPAFVSVFAGRIADTGRDPVPMMAAAVELLRMTPNVELIWASPRELLNIFQADRIGCHIITATHDILAKLRLVGKDLHEYSLETVKMFREDAVKAGYTL